MTSNVCWVWLIAGAAVLGGCDGCEMLAAASDAEIEVTNDLDETYDVTVRGTQVIYALGTDLRAGRCARWPVSDNEYVVEVFGENPACMGESEPFEVMEGETREVALSSIPCK